MSVDSFRSNEQDSALNSTERGAGSGTSPDQITELDNAIDDDVTSAGEQDRIYLNWHPEYTFSLDTVLAYVVYLPPEHHLRSIICRFITMAIPWLLCRWLWLITDIYYESVLDDNRFLTTHDNVQNWILPMFQEEYQEVMGGKFYTRAALVYTAILLACFNMLLLCLLVVTPKDICKRLVWIDEDAKIKGNIPCKKWGDRPANGVTSYSRQLHKAMTHRLSRLLSKSFWNNWWTDRVCRFSPHFRTRAVFTLENKSSKLVIARQFAYLLFLLPAELLYVLVRVLPCFSAFHNLYTSPGDTLLKGLCNKFGPCMRRIVLVPILIVTVVGVLLWQWLILQLTLFLAYIAIFFSIDIIRNCSHTLPYIIFYSSVILYILKAFRQFDEKYRKLKVLIFQYCKELLENSPGVYVMKSDGKTLLFIRDEYGMASIPRPFFDAVCKRFRPYRHEVFKTLVRLMMTLGLLVFLFVVLIEFNVFGEITEAGEGLLMVITVSVPALLGDVRSDTQLSLRKAAMFQGIEDIAENMFKRKDDGDTE